MQPTMEVNEQRRPQVKATVYPTPNPSSPPSLHHEGFDQSQVYDSDDHHHVAHDEAFSNPKNSLISYHAAPSSNNETVVINGNNYLPHCRVCKCRCNDEINYLGRFPPGFRFVPFDDELIVHYLMRKVLDQPLPQTKIREVDLYRYSPYTLAEKYQGFGEKEWYFFTPRSKKYRNGSRPNRASGSGYWKATGADKPITRKGVKVGSRKALVFYEGKAPEGKKTSWIMHEYRVVDPPKKKRRGANDMTLDDWVLCRVYKKSDKFVKVHQRVEEKDQMIGEEAAVSSKTISVSDEVSFLPSGNGNGNSVNNGAHVHDEPYFFDGETDDDHDHEMIDNNYPGRYVQPSPVLQNGGLFYEIPHDFTDDDLVKFENLNNYNLMPSDNNTNHNYNYSYGGDSGGGRGGGPVVVMRPAAVVYSSDQNTMNMIRASAVYPPKEETTATWAAWGGRGYREAEDISNCGEPEIWNQYFPNITSSNLETVMMQNNSNSSSPAAEN